MAQRQTESWDDDGDLQGDIFATSTATVKTSMSSRLSVQSDSVLGEEEWQVPLAPHDEQSTSIAISRAKQAGIPIPTNVPSSALLGGTIKRLGKKKSHHKIQDDWGDDLELPDTSLQPLRIKEPVKESRQSSGEADEFEDWADGSLGIRFAGTRRESKNRSSSASAISPSMGSCMTLESEEDGLDGLVIPAGPLNLEAALHNRKTPEIQDMSAEKKASIDDPAVMTPTETPGRPADDFFSDIDFGAGDIFDPRKRTLNRNVKQNFKPGKENSPASKTQTTLTFNDKATLTKIPRPIPSRPSRLEPVLETGANGSTTSRVRRPEPTTTSAQLLRSKRSMPVLRSDAKPAAKAPLPFSTAAAQHALSHHVKSRSSYSNLRRDSDPSRAQSPPLRPYSRLSAALTPDTPTRQRKDVAPTSLAREAATKRTVTRPTRKRNFGDGSELDLFDDLPTSAAKENKFIKQPSTRLPPKGLRTQASQSRLGLRDKNTTPLPPATPKSPTRTDMLPRFARDTAASRIAREQTLGVTKPRTDGPLMPRMNWPTQVGSRTPHTSPVAHRPARKGPTLINPMGKENVHHFQDDAAKKGMRWNAHLCRWEGNENAVLSFDAAPPPPPSPPRPALIANITGTQGVQVVGGMVFDPQHMRWLKIGAARSDPRSPSIDEDDDPFRDIEDLQDTKMTGDDGGASGAHDGPSSNADWLVGEEFDLGPEFIRRQREEESTWRARVDAWFTPEREAEGEGYMWAIRDIAVPL